MKPDKIRLRTTTDCAGLFLFALALRAAIVAATQFDGLYGQDAFAYYDAARRLLDSTSRLHLPAPFTWPLGYPALIALAFVLAGIAPSVGQWVSIVAGALLAPLIYLLTRELSGAIARTNSPSKSIAGMRGAALAAGLVAAVSGQLVQSSIVVMADSAALCWAAFSALALLRYTHARRLRWWLAAALGLVLAIFTRWIYGALLLTWALAFLLTWWKPAREGIAALRTALSHLLIATACALPLGIVQWGALVPSTSLNHEWLTAWNPSNAIGRVFETPDGHFEYPLPAAVFYAQPIAHPYYIFPLLLPFIVFGAWQLRRSPLTYRAVLLGWPLVVYLFLAGIPYENFRFGLALWPPLVVLAGVGLEWAWTRPASPRTKQVSGDRTAPTASGAKRWARPLVGALLALSLLGMLFWSVRGILPFIALKNEQRAIVLAVAAHAPPNATLIALGLSGYFEVYAEDVTVAELYNETPDSLQRFLCATTPVFLLIEPQTIHAQWANRAPDVNVRWLEAHAGLRELARYNAQVLYQVGGPCA